MSRYVLIKTAKNTAKFVWNRHASCDLVYPGIRKLKECIATIGIIIIILFNCTLWDFVPAILL